MSLLLMEACCAFGFVLFVCEIGQRFSVQFDDVMLVIDQFDWNTFPINVQRMLPIIMLNAQEPVELECFGSVMCSRATFKGVSASNIFNRPFEYIHRLYVKTIWYIHIFVMLCF